METKTVKINREKIEPSVMEEAGSFLQAGELVAFPTETVYGLGGDALQKGASRKIYAAKGRPSDNPLIVHIAEFSALEKIVKEVPESAKKLADAFWPGPLTMILWKNKRVPYETTGGMETVAIRMPKDEIALSLIRAAGGYVAAPSANTSGRPSPTKASHVAEDLSGKIAMILDGGPVGIGIESTIVDLSEDTPTILRPGYITKEMLQEVIGPVQMDPGLISADSKVKPKAPGMKYRHYAPKADLLIVNGEEDAVVAKINELVQQRMEAGEKIGILASEETKVKYKMGQVISMGKREDEDSIAQHLYDALRTCDELQLDGIYSENFSTPRIGQAIMNRLLKAAGHHMIEV